MSRAFPVIAAAVLVLTVGCSPGFYPLPHPAEVSHMDMATKQAHIDKVKATLKIFRASALDLRSRGKHQELEQLTRQADHYIKWQVQPILTDFEADNNLRTRLEIAKLQLLCGLVYLEMDNPEWRLYKLLSAMEKRYADQPDVLTTTIDYQDIGFGTISDGMRSLEEQRFLR